MVILFQISTNHVYYYIPFSILRIVCLIFISYDSWFLLLFILLLYWWSLVVMLDPCAVSWNMVLCMVSAGLHETRCELPILLVALSKILLDQYSLIFFQSWVLFFLSFIWSNLLWFKTQRVKSRNNSCIRVTQENSIEFLIPSSLPYILITHGPC